MSHQPGDTQAPMNPVEKRLDQINQTLQDILAELRAPKPQEQAPDRKERIARGETKVRG